MVMYTDNGGIKMDQLWDKLYQAAKEAEKGKRISRYVYVGDSAIAILSESDKIYTGVHIRDFYNFETSAEKSVIVKLLNDGEDKVKKIVLLDTSGKVVIPPREFLLFLYRLMPDTYKKIEILKDYDSNTTVYLGELLDKVSLE